MSDTNAGTQLGSWTDEEILAALVLQCGAPPYRGEAWRSRTVSAFEDRREKEGHAQFFNDLTSRIMSLLPHADLPTVVAIRKKYYEHYGMWAFDTVDSPEAKHF